jgi:hypothetical protein
MNLRKLCRVQDELPFKKPTPKEIRTLWNKALSEGRVVRFKHSNGTTDREFKTVLEAEEVVKVTPRAFIMKPNPYTGKY